MKSEISLNGIEIVKVPEIYNFASFIGMSGHGIFSAGELIEQIKAESTKLKIDLSAQEQKEFPIILSAILESDDLDTRNTAESIVAEFGRRLGLIIYTLKAAEKENRQANDYYVLKDWQPWMDCKKIILVGGLACGLLGERLAYYAQELLKEFEVKDVNIVIGKYPAYSQMIGCARLNQDTKNQAILFDFGHSFIKIGLAIFNNQNVSCIKLLPKLKSQHMRRNYPNKTEEFEDALGLHNFIVKTVLENYLKHGDTEISKHIVISIANNVENGKLVGVAAIISYSF